MEKRKEPDRYYLRRRYCNPFKPGLPAIGNINDADCMIVQAFGRNTVKEDELSNLAVIAKCSSSESLLSNLNEHLGFDPGKPNRDLDMVCRQVLSLRDDFFPFFCQWEVALASIQTDDLFLEAGIREFVIWPEPGAKSFTTRDLLLKAKPIMMERGWHRPIIVAHGWHIVRTYWLTRTILDCDPIVLPEPFQPEIFDRRSVQRWTRGRIRWVIYDLIARAHHLKHGWVNLH